MRNYGVISCQIFIKRKEKQSSSRNSIPSWSNFENDNSLFEFIFQIIFSFEFEKKIQDTK